MCCPHLWQQAQTCTNRDKGDHRVGATGKGAIMAKAKTTKRKKNLKRKTAAEEGAVIEEQIEESDPSVVTATDDVSENGDSAQAGQAARQAEPGTNGDLGDTVAGEEATDGE